MLGVQEGPANSLTWSSSLCPRLHNIMKLTGQHSYKYQEFCLINLNFRLERIVATKNHQVDNLVRINTDNLVRFDVMSIVLGYLSSQVSQTNINSWSQARLRIIVTF